MSLELGVQDPNRYEGSIPRGTNLPVNIEQVVGNATLSVVAGSGSQNSFSTGALVANLRHGYNDIGFYYPTNTNSTTDVTVGFPSIGNQTLTIAPVSKFIRGGVLPVEPDLSTTMSIGRLASAKLSLVSNTQSQTSASLSGQVSASAICDFRDLSNWSQSELSKLAMSASSQFMGKLISKTSYMYLGPEASSRLEPIDSTKVRETGRSLTTTFDTSSSNFTGAYIGFSTKATAFSGAGVLTYVKGPIIPPKCPIRVQAKINDVSGTGYGPISISAVWVKTTGDPEAPLDAKLEEHISYTIAPGVSLFSDTTSEFFGNNQTYLNEGYELGGVFVSITSTAAAISSVTIDFQDYYADHFFGGWRIFKWESVGLEQNLVFNYSGAVEGMPTGILAFYNKSKAYTPVSFQEWSNFQNKFSTNVFTRCCHARDSIRNSDFEQTGEHEDKAAGLEMGMWHDIGKGFLGVTKGALTGGLMGGPRGAILGAANAGLGQLDMAGMYRPHQLQMAGMYNGSGE